MFIFKLILIRSNFSTSYIFKNEYLNLKWNLQHQYPPASSSSCHLLPNHCPNRLFVAAYLIRLYPPCWLDSHLFNLQQNAGLFSTEPCFIVFETKALHSFYFKYCISKYCIQFDLL